MKEGVVEHGVAAAKLQSIPFHVLGAGSIGLLFSSMVRKRFPTYPITLLLRSHHRHRLQVFSGAKSKQSNSGLNNGLIRNGSADGKLFSHTGGLVVSAQISPSKIGRNIYVPAEIVGDEGQKIKNLIITTKAHDACNAFQAVLPRLCENARVFILCNGALAVRDELQKFLSSLKKDSLLQLRVACTTHGAYLCNNSSSEGNITVKQGGVGMTYVEDRDLASLLCESELYGKYFTEAEMENLLWKKLAANCVINPLSAVHNCFNGELLKDQENGNNLSALIDTIIHEVSVVASASNNACELPNFQELQQFVYTVINNTCHNKSSMLQDVLAKRSKTEVDYLNGHVVRMGKQFGVSTPLNKKMCDDVHKLISSF